MQQRVQSLLVLLCLHAAVVHAEDRVEFNRDIRPILSDNCFLCHGLDEASREADLRLDTFEGATEFDSIVPGDPDGSELIRRILSDDESEVMPPPAAEKNIAPEELELIRSWIRQGAAYEEHWAWQPLRRADVPGSAQEIQAGADAIDAFLSAGWAEQGLTPVHAASPREKLRRLSFDLRGLPPTANEVAEFERSPSDALYFEFRDRWMSDLSYAEHQAVRWLDLVRWADTSGFVSDEPIASGAYRAWVIDAIARNMPFDQFSIEQLAGDLIPDPTDGQLIASGYNRIVNTNCEAGAIEKEQLYKLKGEHVRALGTVWLGLTTGCAECHDHKFDPLTAKDYYSLASYFDDLVEAGVYTPGDRRVPLHYVHQDSSVTERDKALVSQIERLKDRIRHGAAKDTAAWESETIAKVKDAESRTEFLWIPSELPAARVIEGEFSIVKVDGQHVRETLAEPATLSRHHVAELMTGYIKQSGQETDQQQDAWYVDVWIDDDHRPDMLGVQISHGDYGRLGWRTANYETYYWGNDTSGQLQNKHSWSDPSRVKRLGDLPTESGWVRLRVGFGDLIKPVPGQAFVSVGMAWLHSGGSVRWGDSGLELRTDKATALELGEIAIRKWWNRPQNRQVYQRRAEYVSKALLTTSGDRDALQSEIVRDAFLQQTQPGKLSKLRRLESELFMLRREAMPVLVSKQAERPKTTRLLKRGDYQDQTGPFVTAAVPEFLAKASSDQKADRLGLARWLFDADNPLTARVFMNRLWQQFYGRGLSETLEDSGTQGDWPSNVALLDWLACEFRDSGWDRNHMVRLLTSTQSYQLSSKPTAQLQQLDPGNRSHARQSRFRLTAESVRDCALMAAGLLRQSDEIPRHSFFPYQPTAYWTNSDKVMYGSRHMPWSTSANKYQYSRSVYAFWKRQNVHPTMLAFDAPTRQECTAQRNITNTPAQALALLNDPIFVEAARVLAEKVCAPTESRDEARLDRVFELTLQRLPTEAEREVLADLLVNLRSRYQENFSDAEALLSVGQSPPSSTADLAELAAWTGVSRSLLNSHEFLNRP